MKFTVEYEINEEKLIEVFTSIYGEKDYEGKTKEQIINMFNCFCQGYFATTSLKDIEEISWGEDSGFDKMEMSADEIFDRITK